MICTHRPAEAAPWPSRCYTSPAISGSPFARFCEKYRYSEIWSSPPIAWYFLNRSWKRICWWTRIVPEGPNHYVFRWPVKEDRLQRIVVESTRVVIVSLFLVVSRDFDEWTENHKKSYLSKSDVIISQTWFICSQTSTNVLPQIPSMPPLRITPAITAIIIFFITFFVRKIGARSTDTDNFTAWEQGCVEQFTLLQMPVDIDGQRNVFHRITHVCDLVDLDPCLLFKFLFYLEQRGKHPVIRVFSHVVEAHFWVMLP